MARQTRERMFLELAKPATIAGTSHFADSIFGRLVQIDGKRRWEAL